MQVGDVEPILGLSPGGERGEPFSRNRLQKGSGIEILETISVGIKAINNAGVARKGVGDLSTFLARITCSPHAVRRGGR